MDASRVRNLAKDRVLQGFLGILSYGFLSIPLNLKNYGSFLENSHHPWNSDQNGLYVRWKHATWAPLDRYKWSEMGPR